MKRAPASVLILALAVGSGSPAAGSLVSTDRGRNDCWVTFDVEGGRAHCRDGDPSCDADGTADGVCTFAIGVCVDVKNVPDCRPRRITQVVVRASGDAQLHPVSIPLPPLPVRRETCGEVGFVQVALRGHRRLKPGNRRLLLRATTPQGLSDLDYLKLYCLPNAIYCLANPDGGPRAVRLTVAGPGSDFDVGTSGATHNARLPDGWKLDLCLLGCDADTNPVCQATGVGGGFAPPLPIVAGGVPLCLVTGVESVGGLRGTADVRSGAIDLAGTLATDVYVTDETHVCPRCLASEPELTPGLTCDSGAFAGGACIVDGIAMVGDTAYAVSRGCVPSGEQLAGSIAVPVALTTGSSTLAAPRPPVGTPVTPPACDDCTEGICAGDTCASRAADGTCVDVKGGVSQACCASEPTRPCFPDVVERVGATVIPAPAWPDPAYPKSASGAVLAATFCAPASGSSIDGASGLPGPGALLVPVTEGWVR